MPIAIGGIYMEAGLDLSRLEKDVQTGTSMVARAGDAMAEKFRGSTTAKVAEVASDMARAYGDGTTAAIDYLRDLGTAASNTFDDIGRKTKESLQGTLQDTKEWVEEHKVLLGTLAVAVAGVWVYKNQDTVAEYWGKAKATVSEGVDSIKAKCEELATAADPYIRQGLATALDAASEASAKHAAALMDLAEKYDKLSAYSGRSVSELQTLGLTAAYTRTSMDSLTGMLDKVVDAQTGTSDGAKRAAAQFAAFGVSLKNADGSARGEMDVLTDLIHAEAKFADGTKKVAAERVIFGEQLNKDTHDLLTHAQTWDTVQQEIQRLGSLMTQDEIDFARKYKASKDQEAAETQIWAQKEQAVYLQRADTLSQISESLLSGQTTAGQALSQGWDAYLQSFESFAAIWLSKHETLAKITKAAIESGGLPLVDWAQQQLDAALEYVARYIQAGGDLAAGFIQGFSDKISTWGQALAGALETVGLDTLSGKLQDQVNKVTTAVTATATSIRSSVSDAAATVKGSASWATGTLQFFTDELLQADKAADKAIDLASKRAKLSDAYARDVGSRTARPVASVVPEKATNTGPTSTDLEKFIGDIRNSALAEQYSLLGDSFGAKDQTNIKNYEHELADLQKKLEAYKGSDKALLEAEGRYWIEYRKGIADARLELEKWKDAMSFWGDIDSKIATITGDLETGVNAALIKLQEESVATRQKLASIFDSNDKTTWDTAVKAAGQAGADVVSIWAEADAKLQANAKARDSALAAESKYEALAEQKIREDALGELATVDAAYWEKRRGWLEESLAWVKQNCADENAYEVYAAKQRSELRKKEIEARIGYETSFLDTLRDVLADEFGLYKDSLTQRQEAWVDFAKGIATGAKELEGSVADSLAGSVTDFAFATDRYKSKWSDTMGAFEDMFQSTLKKIIQYALNNYIVVPVLTELVGGDAASAITGTKGSGSSWLSDLLGGTKNVGSLGSLFSGGSTAAGALSSAGVYSASSYGLGSTLLGETSSLTGAAAAGGVWDAASAASFSALPSVAESLPSLAEATTAATAATTASTAATTGLGISVGSLASGIGAVAGLVGLGVSLFSSSHTEEKTGSGYSIGVSGLSLSTSGEDYYRVTDSSIFGSSTSHEIRNTGALDPNTDAAIKADFKTYTDSLVSSFKALGVSTDSASSFYFPQWDVTQDQLDDFNTNVTNALAAHIIQAEGLTTAMKILAQENETYIAEMSRLGTAYATADTYLQVYGYDLSDLADITQETIDSLRDTGDSTMDLSAMMGTAAAGTDAYTQSMADGTAAVSDGSAAVAGMATDAATAAASLDATGTSVDGLAASAAAATDTVQATDETLRTLAEADYASKLIDAVGGSDEFKSAIERLVKHSMTGLEAMEHQADYYAGKFDKLATSVGQAGATTDQFWAAFDEAMHHAMDPETFAAWNDAAKFADALDTLQDSIDAANEATLNFNEDLDARIQKAQGLSNAADVTEQMAKAEKELYDARTQGYDAATLARLQEVQALELSALLAKQAKEYEDDVAAANKRFATATKDNQALIQAQIQANAEEYASYEQKYIHAPGHDDRLFKALEAAYTAEILNMVQSIAEATAAALQSFDEDLEERKLVLAGDENAAAAAKKLAQYENELAEARKNGIDETRISDLAGVQRQEMDSYWDSLIEKMKSGLEDLYAKQASLLNAQSGKITTAWDTLTTLMTRYKAGETTLQDTIISTAEDAASAFSSLRNELEKTIFDIRSSSETTTYNPDQQAANSLAYFDETYAKAAAGDTTAASNVQEYAKSYLQAKKASTTSVSEYQAAQDYIVSKLGSLQTTAGTQAGQFYDIATSVNQDKIEQAEQQYRQAQVDKLKSQYDLLHSQAVSAFQNSTYGQLIQKLANTGVGWEGGLAHLNDTDNWNGANTGQRAADRLVSHPGEVSSYLSYYLNNYGAGTGYVDWDSALTEWIAQTQSRWPSYPILPDTVATAYDQAQSAYTQWQNLKTQYGFAKGGMLTGGIPGEDSTWFLGQPGESILDVEQTGLVRRLGQQLEMVYAGSSREDLAGAIWALASSVEGLRTDSHADTGALADKLADIVGMLTRCGGKGGALAVTVN